MVSVAVFCAHRDKNAAINSALVRLSRVRMANPEFTPDDALLSRRPSKKQEVIAWNKILTWLCFQLVYVLSGLKQKLSPNQAQTGFISGKYVHIFLQPAYKSIRYSCSKS